MSPLIPEQVDALQGGRELEAAVAEFVLGYTCCCEDGPQSDCPIHGRQPNALQRYSTDPTATRQVEDEIERRGLQQRYTVLLSQRLMDFSGWLSWRDSWALIRATPEQRCRAALDAVRLQEAR